MASVGPFNLEIPGWMLDFLKPGDEIPVECGPRHDLVRIDAIDGPNVKATWLRELAPDESVPMPKR